MVDVVALRWFSLALSAWLREREAEALAYCTLFVLDLASRRVHIPDSTPHPNALFMQQAARTLVFADDGPLATTAC